MSKVIKTIILLAVNTAAITIAYKIGSSKGYEYGWNDGSKAGACAKCVFDGPQDCSDIHDFEGIYS